MEPPKPPNSPFSRSSSPSSTAFPLPGPAPLPPARPRFRTGRLWAGGVMAAVAAALTTVATLFLIRGVLDIPVCVPSTGGTTDSLAGGAALAALVATALLHLLMVATPCPERLFFWIVAPATAIMVLLPFTTAASLASKSGTAMVYLLIGAVIGLLLDSVAHSEARRGAEPERRDRS
ncbi:DUF6069 family protein [Streptomyces sp. NPDC102467]|uniref:DUF6069 family protein n=1 Tax=Streptomyces sp. NPDC102467 TaxID=3366179 RepID=UPI0038072EA2